MIAAASECRVSLPPVIEYDADRADLPLVVVPVSIPSMTTLLRDRLDEFAGLARVRIHTDWTDDEDVLAARMSDATVVMSTGFRASARLLERIAGRVRCITFCGTGAVSFIDLVGELNARTHQGGWPGADITELSGRTLGIIGFGGIGRRVARLAHGIGLRLLVWDRHPDAAALAALNAESAATMDEVFSRADIVSLHLALNNATRGIIGPAQLDLMRPGTLLVNTARAELIEPGAMLRRLSRGDIAAAIDVTAPEPLPDDDPAGRRPVAHAAEPHHHPACRLAVRPRAGRAGRAERPFRGGIPEGRGVQRPRLIPDAPHLGVALANGVR